jgi:SAM-dependent methyltransferase
MAEKHFSEQEKHTRDYLLPYFRRYIPGFNGFRVLEVGCAEGGFLNQLNLAGIDVYGLELEASRVEIARRLVPQVDVQVGDITDPAVPARYGTPFDLIVMRDVIEHIPERDKVFTNLSRLLKSGGLLYITFPPKYSAFAGHQQNARSLIKQIPFFHLLPRSGIRKTGTWLKENPLLIDQIITNYQCGLTIHKFEILCHTYGFYIHIRDLFFSRPVFKTRFGWPIIPFPRLPLVKEFMATGCEYLLQKE